MINMAKHEVENFIDSHSDVHEIVNPRAMLVWNYFEAPQYLQDLSENGGDEDYIAEVPPNFGWVSFLEEGTAFGCCTVEKHKHPRRKGWVVYIGCHA